MSPQKCLAHLQRSIRDVLATKPGRARAFGEQRQWLRQEALELWHAYRDGHRADYKADAEALQAEITSYRCDRRLKAADHQRLLHELGWPHDRGNLGRLMAAPRGEPTNNRAERALRPAVIARKVSQGSKNDRGAGALAVFTHVIRTLRQSQAGSVVATLAHLWRPPNPNPFRLDPGALPLINDLAHYEIETLSTCMAALDTLLQYSSRLARISEKDQVQPEERGISQLVVM